MTVVRYPPLAAAGKADRDRIIETARAASGSYDYRAVASLAWDSLARLRRKGCVAPGAATSADFGGLAPRDAQAFLCGDFVFDVFDRTFRDRNPLNVPPLMLSPAGFPRSSSSTPP